MRFTTRIKRVEFEFFAKGYTEQNIQAVFALLDKIDVDNLDGYTVHTDEVSGVVCVSVVGLYFAQYDRLVNELEEIFV